MDGHANKCFMNYKVSILHGTWQMVHKSDYQNDKDQIFLRILIIEYSLQQLANQHGVLTIMSFMVDHNFLLIWLFFFFLSLRIRYAADVCILIADFVNLLLSKSPN